MDMSEKKITQIEELLSHHDQQIQDLSEMIIRQGADIDRLKRHIQKLETNMQVMKDDRDTPQNESGLSVSDIAARDKPPHY